MMNVLQIPTNGTNIYQSDYSYSVFFDEEKRIIYPPYFRRELSFFPGREIMWRSVYIHDEFQN